MIIIDRLKLFRTLWKYRLKPDKYEFRYALKIIISYGFSLVSTWPDFYTIIT